MRGRAVKAVVAHHRAFFAKHTVKVVDWSIGPVARRVPEFQVVQAAPGPRAPGLWIYGSAGCWEATKRDEHGVEFVVASPREDARMAELLAMVALYHAGPESQRLDVGHTVPIGEPWLPGSRCDHLLVSAPYPFGTDFEMCRWRGGHARILWLLPITAAERDFKIAHGQDALEQCFEDAELEYWVVERASVV